MTNEKAPERIWLSPASFAYKTSPAPTYIYSETEREPQDIEYVRADLLATVRAEERRAFINNIAAVLDADDVEALTTLIMKARQSPDLNSETRSGLKSEAEIRAEEREAAFEESAASIVNEAGKVGQLMDLASASAHREERAAIKSTLEDYFKHFFCTCHGSTRTGGHFASCPITIRDEVLGRLAGLETAEK